MGGQSQQDSSADNAVNQELAESQQQEYYAQQQAWQQEHSLIQTQGGLNWSTQPVTNATPNTPTPAPPHGVIGGTQQSNNSLMPSKAG